MENFRNKQLSLKLWAILGSMIKSNAALLTPAWDENHPFVQCVSSTYLPVHHLVAVSVIKMVIRERKRDYIHITFIMGYCYNCPILLLFLLISY